MLKCLEVTAVSAFGESQKRVINLTTLFKLLLQRARTGEAGHVSISPAAMLFN